MEEFEFTVTQTGTVFIEANSEEDAREQYENNPDVYYAQTQFGEVATDESWELEPKSNQAEDLTEEQKANHLKWDADTVMEQLIMQESRHMQMSALVDWQLEHPDKTIREFFALASQELQDQEEEEDE